MGATPVLKTYFMLMVADMNRALRFYSEAFEVSVSFSSPEWSEFEVAGATVALHAGGSAADTETGLGFEVADLHGALDQAARVGGRVTRAPQDRPAERIQLAQLADTEGNLITLAQASRRRSDARA
jgi:predicted enzyme related to lactoylglutathione lyase